MFLCDPYISSKTVHFLHFSSFAKQYLFNRLPPGDCFCYDSAPLGKSRLNWFNKHYTNPSTFNLNPAAYFC